MDRLLQNKAHDLSLSTKDPQEVARLKTFMKNFGVTPFEADQLLDAYWARQKPERKRSVESIPVIGRNIKRKRLSERMVE